MKYIDTEKHIIKSWCNEPEEGALEQARNLANLPFIFKQVCLMPDTHEGYGMPIGGVIATQGVVIPNAVGVDIGCGMLAVKTSLTDIDIDTLKKIMNDIRESVPVGFNHHKEKQDKYFIPEPIDLTINKQEYDNSFYQVGTLGGGNHFIEIQKGDDGFIWYMIHSGSRNVGLKVAKYYNKLAQVLNERWCSSVKKEVELAFLPIETNEAKEYLEEMKWCLDFSNSNRNLMSYKIGCSFVKHTNCDFAEGINIQHNYAKFEHHFGENVLIHRKGATSAKLGEIGIIPGSQGTNSYIVEGLGNEDSFQSCSHGAGRRMGRKQASRELSLENETKLLNDKGILHSIQNISDLDEAPSAYKDIDVVMEEQKDLVKIKVKLTPLAVIKG
jgi:tRNA-splicing ligase RtcB